MIYKLFECSGTAEALMKLVNTDDPSAHSLSVLLLRHSVRVSLFCVTSVNIENTFTWNWTCKPRFICSEIPNLHIMLPVLK